MDASKLSAIATDDSAGAAPKARLSDRMRLEESFAPWRAKVQRHLVFRSALDGVTWGSLAGAAAVGAAWAGHLIDRSRGLRFGGIALLAAGAAIGVALGMKKRWSDQEIALYVDGVLGTPETVTSAIALGAEAPSEVVDAAAATLDKANRKAPRRLRRLHSLALAGVVACIGAIAIKANKPAQASPPVGTDIVKLDHAAGLDRIAEVEKLPARDEAQKKRLAEIAEEARDLKKKLLAGMPRRDALAKLKDLRERLDQEKKQLGSGERKAGMDAAKEALRADGFPGLANALEDRDMQSFDEMMERIANAREDQDREKAKEALEKAIEAAKKKSANDVARELQRQKDKLDKRTDKADVLRELSDALKGSSGDSSTKSKSFQDKATDDAAKDLADSLRKGLEKLTPEERKKLADKLRDQAEKGGASGKMSKKARKRLRDMADKLKTPEGQKELEDELKKEANSDPSDGEDKDDARRKEGLDDGEDGADDTGKELGDQDGKDGKDGKGKDGKGKDGKGKDGKGKDGKGKDGKGKDGKDGDGKDGDGKDGKDGTGKDGKGKDGAGAGDGIPIPMDGASGSPGGGGDGKHDGGKTKKVDAESLRAKAKGVGAHGTPRPGGSTETGKGSDGATATVKSTGDTKGAAAEQVDAVDKAEIPESVRRQVKSYFE